MMKSIPLFCLMILCVAVMGCKDPTKKAADKEAKKKNEPTKTGIFGQTTDEIGEFNPEAGRKVNDGKMKSGNPLNPAAALRAYGPAIQKISNIQITQAVNLFNAANGRYPRDHAEFMEKIIKANGIRLPKLPGQQEYQYDVENHSLVVVEPLDPEE